MVELATGIRAVRDFYAKQHIEGAEKVWKQNRGKIKFILGQVHGLLKPGKKACEIGIGEGYALRKLHQLGLDLTGVDISEVLINYLREIFHQGNMDDIKLIAADAADVDLGDDEYDLFFCFDVLEHIPGDGLKATIRTISKALKRGGLLIGSIPFGEKLQDNTVMCPHCKKEFHRYGHHHSFNSIRDIKIMLGSNLKLLKVKDVNTRTPLERIARKFGRALNQFLFGKKPPSSRRSTIFFISEAI